ncbi:hypothetical protein [uncultured Legionella sp.]|uniref:hypothetical protein n=1 Tax=uncultured Legionella sp. TaxID=210934 RepID=UPI0026383A62|nr:hypothetical protein [uncultured Legionella sp.]
MIEENFYQEFMRFGECEAEVAASLILGLDPAKTISINPIAPRIIKILDASIDSVINKITNDDRMRAYTRDIFFYINRAFIIGIDVHPDCIKAVAIFFSKLSKKIKSPFREGYPHIAKALLACKKTHLPSDEVRLAKWREVAKQKQMEYPDLNKKQLSEIIHAYLKNNHPFYLKKKNKGYYPPSTIERSFKMLKLKK